MRRASSRGAAVPAFVSAAVATILAAACLGASPIPEPAEHFLIRVEVTTPMSRETRRLTVASGAAYRLERITTDGRLAKSCRRPVGSLQRSLALAKADATAENEHWNPHYGLGNAPTDERFSITMRDTTRHRERTTVIDDPTTVPANAMPAGLRALVNELGRYVRSC